MTKPVDLPLGYHLIIDLYECGSNLLIDRAAHDDLSPDSQIANEIAAILKINKEFINKVQNEAEAKTDIQIIVGMDYLKQE